MRRGDDATDATRFGATIHWSNDKKKHWLNDQWVVMINEKTEGSNFSLACEAAERLKDGRRRVESIEVVIITNKQIRNRIPSLD